MNQDTYPLYLGNVPVMRETLLPVYDKYSGVCLAQVSLADSSLIDEAISQAVAAELPFQMMPAFERQAILQDCHTRFKANQQIFIDTLCAEVGKPIKDASIEFERFLTTFQLAAEEAIRITGEVLPLDISPRGIGYTGLWKRVPLGASLFITPFNFPLNLAAHKIAPAIAVGCPFILKPASLTPITALMMGKVLAETNLPKGAFSILPCQDEQAERLVIDQRLKLLSFTGSDSVGWRLKSIAGKKSVILELGGNAGCIVDAGVDLDFVAERLVFGAFYQSGQSCISVQRIYIHHQIYEPLKNKMVEKIKILKLGNPKDKTTTIGPLISEKDAKRVMEWIEQAKKAGAKVICGGILQGKSLIEPTLLEKVADDQKLNCEEAFGPIAVLAPFTEFEQALQKVNDSRFGLQAGVFTPRLDHAFQAWDSLQVGGVIINDVPSWRSDNMPYGGNKDSGSGREGVRFAMEHLSERRMLVIKSNP